MVMCRWFCVGSYVLVVMCWWFCVGSYVLVVMCWWFCVSGLTITSYFLKIYCLQNTKKQKGKGLGGRSRGQTLGENRSFIGGTSFHLATLHGCIKS